MPVASITANIFLVSYMCRCREGCHRHLARNAGDVLWVYRAKTGRPTSATLKSISSVMGASVMRWNCTRSLPTSGGVMASPTRPWTASMMPDTSTKTVNHTMLCTI